MHYLDHAVHAPAMTLEHLVDQYWFPAFGLLISSEGRVWRHSFLVPYSEGYLSSIKAIVDRRLLMARTSAGCISNDWHARLVSPANTC